MRTELDNIYKDDLLLFIPRRKAVHFLAQLICMEGICGDVFPMSMGGF